MMITPKIQTIVTRGEFGYLVFYLFGGLVRNIWSSGFDLMALPHLQPTPINRFFCHKTLILYLVFLQFQFCHLNLGTYF